MNIGSRIKDLRKSKKLTQTEFGKHIDFSKSYIASIETNAQAPSFNLIGAILKHFNCSADWLINGNGSMHPSANAMNVEEPREPYLSDNIIDDEFQRYHQELFDRFLSVAKIKDYKLIRKLMLILLEDYPEV